MKTIDSPYEAFVHSLVLGITAQTEEQKSRIDPQIEEFSTQFDRVTIERAKKEALHRIDIGDIHRE